MSVVGGPDAVRLAAAVHDRLAGSRQTVAVAESCTGGGLGAVLTSVPGSSRTFVGGVIAYNDRVKRDLLAVPADALTVHGAVSEPVARYMATGIREVCGADWGIGITGVAGPGGGSREKPVGTVWIAVDGARHATIVRAFKGDREAVRRHAVIESLEALIRLLEGADD
jgi:nicotinamide-nucleotide amidase